MPTNSSPTPVEPTDDTDHADDTDHTDDHSAAVLPRRRITMLLLTAVGVLALDVVSKALVVAMLSDRPPVRLLGGLVYLTETRNTGAAFSFAQGATVLFTLIAIAVVAVILRTAPRLRSVPWAVCLGLILGGAAGNLTDRLARAPGPLRGAVVDWISLLDAQGRAWPIFNLADSAIVCGGVLAVVLAALGYQTDGGRVRRERRDGAGGGADGIEETESE